MFYPNVLFGVTRNGKNLISLQEREGSNIKFIQGILDDEDMLGDKDEEKISYGLQENDIIEMQVWGTSHKIYFNKVNLLTPSV